MKGKNLQMGVRKNIYRFIGIALSRLYGGFLIGIIM